MLSYLVGFSLSDDLEKNIPYIWRLNLGFPVIFCILRLIFIKFVYRIDTPAYYL